MSSAVPVDLCVVFVFSGVSFSPQLRHEKAQAEAAGLRRTKASGWSLYVSEVSKTLNDEEVGERV